MREGGHEVDSRQEASEKPGDTLTQRRSRIRKFRSPQGKSGNTRIAPACAKEEEQPTINRYLLREKKTSRWEKVTREGVKKFNRRYF